MSNRRLFFALWPDDETRLSLFHWQTHNLPADVRWQHRDDLHTTLHFLGAIPEDRTERLFELGDTLDPPRFVLVLDQVGYWSRPKILWAGPTSIPGELRGLHRQLGERLQSLGFETDSREYRPHVTLARKVRAGLRPGPLQPLSWKVREMALVESRPGVAPMYHPIRRWRLS